MSRLVTTLADTFDTALPAIRAARAPARARAWDRCRPLDGPPGSRHGGQVIVDLDVTLVRAHSEKEGAEPTYKRGFGFARMCAFVHHGEHGSGETLVVDLRNCRASAFDSATHIAALDSALAQLPESEQGQVLVRTDSAGASNPEQHPSRVSPSARAGSVPWVAQHGSSTFGPVNAVTASELRRWGRGRSSVPGEVDVAEHDR